jgi:Rps23 Pro-64 3,4-dihydroxylase Tpa1-like proline 4-hydroxylase
MEQIVHINLGPKMDYQITYKKEITENDYRNRRNGHFSRTQDNKLYSEEKGKIVDLLSNEQPVFSWYGSSSGDKVDPNIRSSKKYETQITMDKNIYLDAFKRICPTYLHPAITWNDSNYVTMVVYREGDFFKKHTDTKKNNHHFATVLLFPPCEFTGGVLEIERTDGTTFQFTGSNTDWNLIIFEPTLKHSCSEVLSGERLVFKTKGLYDDYLYKYYRDLVSTTEIPENLVPKEKENKEFDPSESVKKAKEGMKKTIDSLLNSDFSKEPDEYNETYQNLITKIQSEWEIVNEQFYLNQKPEDGCYSIKNILSQIKSENDVLVKFVVLESFYHDPIPANLFAFDLELLKEIRKVYPTAYLKNIPAKIKNDEYSDCDFYQEYIEYPKCWDDGKKKNTVITVAGMHSGELKLKGSEYNDEGYDPVYHRNYTCIVILKSE